MPAPTKLEIAQGRFCPHCENLGVDETPCDDGVDVILSAACPKCGRKGDVAAYIRDNYAFGFSDTDEDGGTTYRGRYALPNVFINTIHYSEAPIDQKDLVRKHRVLILDLDLFGAVEFAINVYRNAEEVWSLDIMDFSAETEQCDDAEIDLDDVHQHVKDFAMVVAQLLVYGLPVTAALETTISQLYVSFVVSPFIFKNATNQGGSNDDGYTKLVDVAEKRHSCFGRIGENFERHVGITPTMFYPELTVEYATAQAWLLQNNTALSLHALLKTRKKVAVLAPTVEALAILLVGYENVLTSRVSALDLGSPSISYSWLADYRDDVLCHPRCVEIHGKVDPLGVDFYATITVATTTTAKRSLHVPFPMSVKKLSADAEAFGKRLLKEMNQLDRPERPAKCVKTKRLPRSNTATTTRPSTRPATLVR